MCVRLMQIINRFNTVRFNGKHCCQEGFFIGSTHHAAEVIGKLALFSFSKETNFISKMNETGLANCQVMLGLMEIFLCSTLAIRHRAITSQAAVFVNAACNPEVQ